MFKRTATDLTKLSRQTVKEWLGSFDTVLSDCDGNNFFFFFQLLFMISNATKMNSYS